MQDDLLFVGGVARLLEVSEKTVRQLVKRGELHAERVAGIRVFKAGEVQRYAKEREKDRKRSQEQTRGIARVVTGTQTGGGRRLLFSLPGHPPG
jgi:excisionase family DNA binding protein